MSPLPFQVLTNGHCQGDKHLVVGDALSRRFGLDHDPGPLLDYLARNLSTTYSATRTKRHRLALERILAEVPLLDLACIARGISMFVPKNRSPADNHAQLLDFTATFDMIHTPCIEPLLPVMAARTSQYLDKIDPVLQQIDRDTSDPDVIAARIAELQRATNTDDGWVAEHERDNGTKIDLETFTLHKDSKAYQMLEENLTLFNYPTSPPNLGADDRVFSTQVVCTLANADVFGPKTSAWSMNHVDYPRPLHECAGDVVMFMEDFLEMRPGDVLHQQVCDNSKFTGLHVILGSGSVMSVEDELKIADSQSRTLPLRIEVDYVDWRTQQDARLAPRARRAPLPAWLAPVADQSSS